MIKETVKYVLAKRNRIAAAANRAKSKAVLNVETVALRAASNGGGYEEEIETVYWGFEEDVSLRFHEIEEDVDDGRSEDSAAVIADGSGDGESDDAPSADIVDESGVDDYPMAREERPLAVADEAGVEETDAALQEIETGEEAVADEAPEEPADDGAGDSDGDDDADSESDGDDGDLYAESGAARTVSLKIVRGDEHADELWTAGSLDRDDGYLLYMCGSVAGDVRRFAKQLKSLRPRFSNADLVLADVRGFPETDYAHMREELAVYGVCGLGGPNLIHLYRVVTPRATVGVVMYNRNNILARTTHIKLELSRAIKSIKNAGADYIVVYINERASLTKPLSKTASLYESIARAGANYIVGVAPRFLDSGTTFFGEHHSIVRSVYSLGAFLTPSKTIAPERAVLRIRLKKSDAGLEVTEESYVPYVVAEDGAFEGLVAPRYGNDDLKRRGHLAVLEHGLSRLVTYNKAMSIGQLMDVLGIQLPDNLSYIADKPLGKVCARTFEVRPGDIFFFREPFEDPNDLEPVDPTRRLRLVHTARNKGAVFFVSFTKLSKDYPHVVVESAIESHIAACRFLRDQLGGMRVIGITGSIGKTSTKDLLYSVLKTRYRVQRSERNENVQVKIGVRLQRLESDCQYFLQEIGGGRPGGASRHARMVAPEMSVVTNIGDAHIGNFFGDQRKLMENKLGIIEGMPRQGVLYLNGDDPLLITAQPDCEVVYYAVHNKDADYYADDIVETETGTTFTIVHGNHRAPMELNVLGEHNVLNAVCCYAIAMHIGMPEYAIRQGLAAFKTAGIRQNVVRVAGRTLLMDCYNASSDSVESALEMLNALEIEEGHKRIAVFGDITGMGELSEPIHRDMGEAIARHPEVDEVVLFGNETRFAKEVLDEKGVPSRWIDLSNHDELDRIVEELVAPGDAVMFKGSSKMLLEYSCDVAFGTRFTDRRLIDESEYRRVRKDGMSFNLFKNHATLVLCDVSKRKNVTVPRTAANFEVANMTNVFRNTSVQSVKLPDTLRHMDAESFAGCASLEKVGMPASLKYMGNRAFKKCESLKAIDLPDGLVHIGASAFDGCVALERIYVPESVSFIGSNAFNNCFAVLECDEGSYAQGYFEENGLRYELRQRA